MRIVWKTAILLLGMASVSQVASPQSQVKGAYGGAKGIFVYLKALSPYNSDNIVYCSVERRESGSGDWKAVATPAAPQSENDFTKELRTAIANMPYDLSFLKDRGPEIWKNYRKIKATDSLRIWYGFIPVQEALGVVYHDLSVKPDVSYEYRIRQFDANGQVIKTLYYLPARFPGENSKWDIPYEGYTTAGPEVRVTWGAPGAKLPPFARVLRQDRNAGEWIPASSEIFSHTSKDSVFISATDKDVTPGAIYRYKLIPMDIFGNPGKESESALIAVYNFTMEAPVIQELKAVSDDSIKGIRISWLISRNDLVNSIRIFRSTDYDNGYTLLAEVPSTSTGYVDQTIDPAKKYYYKITITGPLGESSVASARVFAISDDKSKPLPPVIVSADGTKKGIILTINVTENNLSGVRVFRKNENDRDFIPVSELLPVKDNMVRWEDTTGISGTRFYGYAARSENASHFQGDLSETVWARSGKPVAVPVVIGLTAAAYDAYNKLYWTDMQFGENSVGGYIVLRKEMPDGTLKQINDTIISPDINSYTDRTPESNKGYAYSVVLIDEFGNKSEPCNQVTVMPKVIPVRPPSSVTAASEPDFIRVTWTEVQSPSLKEYRVYRYVRGAKATLTATVPAGSQGVYLDRNVRKDQLYFYFITTVDTNGKESQPSDEAGIRKN